MAKFKRLLTEEQLNAIAVGRVQGVSLRGIARSTGIPYETVRDASKRPDVVKVVESVQADIAADADRTTDAVRAERKRETSRKSSATARAKAAAPKIASAAPPPPKRKPPEKKKGLGFVRFGWDANGNFGTSGSGHGDSLSESESFEEFLTRKDEERDLAPYPAPIAILTDDGSTSYDRLITQEIGHAADFLMTYCPGAFSSRNECISALANATTTIDLRSATLLRPEEAPEGSKHA
jgi:hypothetical protein